jgi:long-chain acyl-CoA synthetase
MGLNRTAAACAAALGGRETANRAWITTDTREVTFGALAERIGRVAALVRKLGLKVGDRAVIATADDCEASLLFVAMVCNGITVVQLDPLIARERAQSLTRKADPALVVADEALAARWGLAELGPQVIEIAPPAARAGLFGGLMKAKPASGLLALLDSLSPEAPPASIPPETLAYILFTSGTTKEPKGVCISHRALFAHLETLSRTYGYSEKSRILNTLMLSHADGMIQGPMIAFFNAAGLFRPVKFEITTMERLLDSVFQQRITHMIAVPTMLSLMVRLSEHQDEAFEGGDFQLLVSCGAALEPSLWEAFEAKFKVRIINVYGLTETVVGGVFAGPGVPRDELGAGASSPGPAARAPWWGRSAGRSTAS